MATTYDSRDVLQISDADAQRAIAWLINKQVDPSFGQTKTGLRYIRGKCYTDKLSGQERREAQRIFRQIEAELERVGRVRKRRLRYGKWGRCWPNVESLVDELRMVLNHSAWLDTQFDSALWNDLLIDVNIEIEVTR